MKFYQSFLSVCVSVCVSNITIKFAICYQIAHSYALSGFNLIFIIYFFTKSSFILN